MIIKHHILKHHIAELPNYEFMFETRKSSFNMASKKDRTLCGAQADSYLRLRSVFKFHVCFCGLDPGNLNLRQYGQISNIFVFRI